MARKQRTKIRMNDNNSLEGLAQEVYNDACLQIIEAQSEINKLTTGLQPNDVDDATKIAKEKSNFLKIKDSSIKVKLELAKLQADIIKHSDTEEDPKKNSEKPSVSMKDFKSIREMIKENAMANSIGNEEEETI